jgi:N-lysine methyltransferase SETD6
MIDDAFVIVRPKAESRLQDLIPVDLKMLITAFCQPAENFSSSKLSDRVNDSGLRLSEASLLFTAITNRLSDYKTSLQEDTEILDLLKNGKSFQHPEISRHRYEMALQVRKGEKEILHHVLQLFNEFIAKETHQMAVQPAKRKRDENDSAAANKKSGRK